jgi:hypothetical protein
MSDQTPRYGSGNGNEGTPPPAPPSYPEGPGASGPSPEPASTKGFFAALFDFSFESFVTPKIVKVVYLVITMLVALGLIVFIIGGFVGDQPALGILFLIVGPLAAIVYLAFFRMMLEMYFAIVRMSEDIHRRGV